MSRELGPLVRMTAPEPYASQNILDWPAQQPLFQSWALLFGVLPIDRHSFYFERIHPESGFREQSSTWTNRHWCHTRVVTTLEQGCRVTDTVRFRSRIPLVDILFKPTYRLVFRWSHRVLRRRYDGRAGPA